MIFFTHTEYLLLALTQNDKEKYKRARTSKNSEGKADRSKKENSKNIHSSKNQLQCGRKIRNDQVDELWIIFSPNVEKNSDDGIKSHFDCDAISDWNIAFKQFPIHT